MGLGISVPGTVTGKLARAEFAELCKALHDSITAQVTDPVLMPLLMFETGESGSEFYAFVFPLSEPLQIVSESPGTLTVMTKTSTNGPGYHAWLVDLINAVGRDIGIRWDWKEDELEFGATGDFTQLQDDMCGQLVAMADAFFTDDQISGAVGKDCTKVNMRMGYSVDTDGWFTATAVGPLPREWWADVRAQRDLPARCRDFYVWWNRDMTPADSVALGRALLWTEVTWRPPADEREAAIAQAAIDLCRRAAAADPTIRLPETELAELQTLLDAAASDDENAKLPEIPPRGIGYHRRKWHQQLPGSWTVTIEGYFYGEWDGEDATQRYFYGDRVVHLSMLGMNDRSDSPVPKEKILEAHQEDLRDPAAVDSLAQEDDLQVGQATISKFEEDEYKGFRLSGIMATDGNVARVTIVFADKSHARWAEDVWRSLRHTPQPAAG